MRIGKSTKWPPTIVWTSFGGMGIKPGPTTKGAVQDGRPRTESPEPSELGAPVCIVVDVEYKGVDEALNTDDPWNTNSGTSEPDGGRNV